MMKNNKKDMDALVLSVRNLSGSALDCALKNLFSAFDSTIRSCIRKYPTFNKEDLESVAHTALWESALKYDPEKGDCSNYLTKSIYLEVANEVSKDNSLVHIPDGKRTNIRKVNRAKEDLEEKGNSHATVLDIMQVTRMKEKEVKDAMMISSTVQNIASLDAPLSCAEESLCLGDTVASMEESDGFDESQSLKKALKKALAKLPEKEKKVYLMRKGLNGKSATNKEIMHALDMSEPTVIKYFRQAEEKVQAALSDWNPSR